jgi:hypothetical protein
MAPCAASARDFTPRWGPLSIKPAFNFHLLRTTEKIRPLVDNIGGKKESIIEGEVAKGDDDG